MNKSYIFYPKNKRNRVLKKLIFHQSCEGIVAARQIARDFLADSKTENPAVHAVLISKITTEDTVYHPFTL